MQLAHGLAAPCIHEAAAGKRGGFACPRQIGAVATGTIGGVERAALNGLFGGERRGYQSLRQRMRAEPGRASQQKGSELFHRRGTSSCGRKPWPGTGTASPAKGWGGSSQPVRFPSGAFSLSS